MKKILIFFFFAILWQSFALKSQGIFNFEKETHDFGTLEEGVVASYEFEFTNTGDQPIEISEVKASCGCTTPYWSKELIMPGKKGKIKASYNTQKRPGPFNKSITIKSNARKDVKIIYIKGYVAPNETSIKRQEGLKYGQVRGDTTGDQAPLIRLEKKAIEFGDVLAGVPAQRKFHIFNEGKQNLIITGLKNECDCLSFGLTSGVIPPGGYAVLELNLKSDQVREINEYFTISSNDPEQAQVRLKIKGNVYENFGNRMFRGGPNPR